MPRITLKQIKRELAKATSLTEKRSYLESLLKIVKSKKLLAKIKELLEELNVHLGHSEKLGEIAEITTGQKPVVLEQKLAELPELAEKTEVPKAEYKIELEQKLAPLQAAPKQEYAKQEYVKQPQISYERAKEMINTLKNYFTKVLGLDLGMLEKSDIVKNEVEEHIKNFFNLGETWEDRARIKSYVDFLVKEEEKYKKRSIDRG